MGAPQLIAVCDTGPLIHLAEIGCLEFLSQFNRLHIPSVVIAETVGKVATLPAGLSVLSNIEHHSPSLHAVLAYVQVTNLESLHSGERHCLYLCNLLKVPLILTDDLAVRKAAKRLGITPVGTLGIIVWAYRHNLVAQNQAEQHLLKLHQASSLFVTKALIDLAIKDLRQ